VHIFGALLCFLGGLVYMGLLTRIGFRLRTVLTLQLWWPFKLALALPTRAVIR
jgi:hypothetical protein